MSRRSPESSARQCPVCGKPQDEKLKPFCSKCCADVDLSRWLNGVYAVPADEDSQELPHDAADL